MSVSQHHQKTQPKLAKPSVLPGNKYPKLLLLSNNVAFNAGISARRSQTDLSASGFQALEWYTIDISEASKLQAITKSPPCLEAFHLHKAGLKCFVTKNEKRTGVVRCERFLLAMLVNVVKQFNVG